MSHTGGSPGGGTVDHDPGASRSYSGNPRDTGQGQDPSDRNRYRRRRQRRKLPSAFADFRLADGRTLREALGEGFFGKARPSGKGKWMSKDVREWLEAREPHETFRRNAEARRTGQREQAGLWRWSRRRPAGSGGDGR